MFEIMCKERFKEAMELSREHRDQTFRAHPIKSVASLPKYQRYTIEKERYVPNSTQLASKCLKLGVE